MEFLPGGERSKPARYCEQTTQEGVYSSELHATDECVIPHSDYRRLIDVARVF